MDKPKITPKDFFLWAGAMISLYWSISAFIFLMFEYINYAFPNSLSNNPSDPYQSSIPLDMASLIVIFPIFLLLSWLIRRTIIADATRADVWVRRWAILFTLFVAGATAVIDIVVLLTSFLQGEEITGAFIVKIVVVLLVSAALFMHFTADLWGYWNKNLKKRNIVLAGVILLLVLTIGSGFIIVGTPRQARLYNFDQQKVDDLESIQSQVVSYYQQNQNLPHILSDMNDASAVSDQPKDPQTNSQYEYRAVNTNSFELCAIFNMPNRPGSNNDINPSYSHTYGVMGASNWQHMKGHVCFQRTIDPSKYPPIDSQSSGE